ncbi:MAG: vWA domain-containing protein [Myxococcaceae bacterium]
MRNALLKAAFCLALLPGLAQAGRCPNLLLDFDVSGSMGTTVSGTSQSRYEVGRDAVNQLLSSNSSGFRYGLQLFGITTSTDSCGVSNCYYSSSTACQSVLSDVNTNTAIAAVLQAGGPDGSTPTATSITNAMARADMKDATRPRFMILITDGDPNCPSNTLTDTTTALNTAKNAGVKTYVLSFNGGTASNLNAMAQAGGTARNTTCDSANPCYYNASSPAQLQTALNDIVAAVGGELGGGGCDDTCYSAGACAANQICKGGACVADSCATVSCQSGQYCVEGTCKHSCSPACQTGQYCDDGVCKPSAACATACTAKNSVCVNGQCVEDYCSGLSYHINCTNPDDLCIDNACQTFASGTGGGAGGGAGGGSGNKADGGAGGGTASTSGCCSGAPDAASLFGILVGLSSLGALRRRKSAK